MFIPDSEQKHDEPACCAIWGFVGKKLCFKRSDQDTLPQKNPIDAPDVDGDKKFFKTINRLNQTLTNDAAREAYNIFGIDEVDKVMNDKNWYLNFSYEITSF